MIFDDIEVIDGATQGPPWPVTSATSATPPDKQLSMPESCDAFSAKAFSLGVPCPAPPATSSTPEEGVSGARQTITLCPSDKCFRTRCQPLSRSQVVQ